jgi:hypothetical protein
MNIRSSPEDQTMPSTAPWQCWKSLLDSYRYPANLSDFEDHLRFGGWFVRNIEKGDRTETIEFENLFREQAPHHLEAWFEVVVWMYSNKQTVGLAQVIIDTLKCKGTSAQDPWGECCQFTEDPNARRLKAFQRSLGVFGRHIGECSTFPAFIAPDRFPIVDRHITRWVSKYHEEHNMFAQHDVRLFPPTHFENKPLTISDFPFYEWWIQWCRSKAHQLTELSGSPWRARDVEMAVSTAQRRDLRLPPIALEQSWRAKGQ